MTIPLLTADQDVAVAIVNYRTADLIAAALPPLIDEMSGFRRKAVAIVDNASPGDDADRMQWHLDRTGAPSWITLVRSLRNGGFAAGNNAAFAAFAAMDWAPHAVLLLNPDAVVRCGSVRRLAAFLAANPCAGVAGARLEEPDGSSWVAAFNFPSAMGEFARGTGLSIFMDRWPALIKDVDVPVQADWVSGAAMMIRGETLADVGGMDEDYFLYFEEIDYMRSIRRRGWEIWHVPSASVRHDAGGATGIVGGESRIGRVPRYWFHSWLRYFEKNHGLGYARFAAAMKLAGIALGETQRKLRRRPSSLSPRFAQDFARHCLIGRQDPKAR